MHLSKKPTLIFILLLFFTLNCSATKEQKSTSPAKLLREAKRFSKKKEPDKAKNSIQLVMEDFPDSKERITALMMLADLHYNEDEFEESKFHYQKFTELYPAHKHVDRAHFYKAMSNFQLTDLASRDLTPVNSALGGFRNFLSDFPGSKYKENAKKESTNAWIFWPRTFSRSANFIFAPGRISLRSSV